MKYFRVHTDEMAWITKKPRGLFTAVGKLVDAKLLTEEEEKIYWQNREYFERILPVPPFYEQGNPEGAVTWYKDTKEGNRIFHEMSFYRRMAEKYGKKLFVSECGELPGRVIYEDAYQIAVVDENGAEEATSEEKELEKPKSIAPENIERKIAEPKTAAPKITVRELPWPICEVLEEEIPECVRLIRSSFQTVADEFGFTPENAPRFTAFATDERRLWYQMKMEHRPMYGYRKDGRIVGYYSLMFMENGACELNNLCVAPEERHQNIGEELLFDAFVRARELGFDTMKIGIVEENKVLRKWYESYGFEHVGTEKFDFFPFTCGYLEKKL